MSLVFQGTSWILMGAVVGIWPFSRKPKKVRWTVSLSSALQRDVKLAAAWTVYAGTIALEREQGSGTQVGPGGVPDFGEECRARDAMAEFWEVKMKENASEAYLDLLVAVRAAGYVREYVWRFLRRPEWAVPGDLRREAFEGWWAGRGLGEHKAVTLAFLRAG